MTNCEHLIENALMSMEKARNEKADVYKAFVNEMNCHHNKEMFRRVCISQDELWEIAQYIMFTHDEYMKSVFEAEIIGSEHL